eukprot:scaffold10174_cov74-Cylindrotheca_fusiformis.AAC.3
MSSTIEARLARLEAAVGLTVPVSKKAKLSNNGDEKLDIISDLIENLEQKVESNQESIGEKLGEIISCLAELKSEAKSEASAAEEIQTAQSVDAKAASRQRVIEAAINENLQELKESNFGIQKFYDLDVILKLFQRGLTAVVPKASSYPDNPRKDEDVIAYYVDTIHELTGTKPIIKRNGSECIISYPE